MAVTGLEFGKHGIGGDVERGNKVVVPWRT
jgi:hypothetical protein